MVFSGRHICTWESVLVHVLHAFGNCQVLEENCSIHGQLNRFSLDWNDEFYTVVYFWKIFGYDVSFAVAAARSC